jgi:transposase-like protein
MFDRKSLEKRTRTDPNVEGIWSDEKRIEAVATYIALGSMSATRDATGIPLNTLWSWRQRASWWPDVEKQLRGEKNNETSSQLTKIVDKTLEAIRERVADGDYVYNPRSGDIVRVPVSAAGLNKIASTLLDRRLTLDAQVIPETDDGPDTSTKLERQLSKLADSFKDFVNTRKRQEKVIENAIPN